MTTAPAEVPVTRDSEDRMHSTPPRPAMIAIIVALVLFQFRCGAHSPAFVAPSEHERAVGSAAPAPGSAPELVFIAIYERGPRYDDAKPIFEQPSIKEHIAHHEALGASLVAAGPLRQEPGSKTAGVVIIKARDLSAAREWLSSDPAVVSGTLQASIAQWRVSRISAYERSK